MTEKTEKQLPTVANAYPNEIKESVAQNARGTSYPGATNGPADAYRHMLGIAEIRRRTSQPAARVAGNWNERDNLPWRLKKDADSQMDLHNNRIGERIGRVARNTAEAEEMVHAEIRAAAIEGGTGKNSTAIYLAPENWTGDGNRTTPIVWPPHDLAGSSEVERILGKPTRLWTADDARKVMQDRTTQKALIRAKPRHSRKCASISNIATRHQCAARQPRRAMPAAGLSMSMPTHAATARK